jgi:hypothetical protein
MHARERNAAPGKQQGSAAKRDQRARDMMQPQPFAGQQRREQDDEHRPEIADQLRLGGRREPQRQKIERVVAEQPADAQHPDRPGLFQRMRGTGPEEPARSADPAADRKRHRGELKRRHGTGRNGEKR